MKFEKLGLEEITEIVDLVKRFPTSIWLQRSASIQPRTSLLEFEDHRFCRSQIRSHAELLVVSNQIVNPLYRNPSDFTGILDICETIR